MTRDIRDFDFELPPDRIAQRPADPRDAARLMVVDRAAAAIAHHTFRELPELLAPTDVLVLNDTRVIPARLMARRPTGGKVEILLVEEAAPDRWLALLKPSKRVAAGERLAFAESDAVAVAGAWRRDGVREIRF